MQTRTQSTVVAVFRNSAEAQAALSDLKASGFSSSDVFIDNANNSGAFGNETRTDDTTTHHEGGITGWFKSIFGQEEHDDRPYYESAANSGHVLLSATVSDESLDRVADILERHSPVDVHREASSDGDAFETTSDRGALNRGNVTQNTAATTAGTDQAIPVVREDLQVGKRTVLRGGVRVYSRMVDTPVEEQVQLRDEHVHVNRTPVDREATAADLRPGQEQVFEVKEYAEEPVIAKTARVVEEIRVGKESTERTETVRENVRHTEVKVDNLNEANARMGNTEPTQTGIGYAGSTTGTGLANTTATGGLGNFDSDYRSDFQRNYGAGGGRYEDYQPAYQYGNTIANDPRYKGRSWDEIEPSLRSEYSSKYPNSTWEKMKNSVRYGWDRVTGKA